MNRHREPAVLVLIIGIFLASVHHVTAREPVVARVLRTRLSAVQGEVMRLSLDGSLKGQAGGRTISAKLGPGAKFVDSVEGQGVEPGPEGPAVTVDVPEDLWTPQGTLMFRMKLSRALRPGDDGVRFTVLNCPIFELSLVQRRTHLRLRADLKTQGEMTHQQAMNRFALGKVMLSHLKGDRWYHVAISWDSTFPDNELEMYLNGATQAEMRPGRAWWWPWNLPEERKGALTLGGSGGEGTRRLNVAVDSIALYPVFMNGDEVGVELEGRPNFPLTGEGRWDYGGSLDLTDYELTPLYETEFDEPLNWVAEDELFDGDERVRRPEGKDWVLEGGGDAWTENGRLVVVNAGQHQVLWNTREFPENFLLEFGILPRDDRSGLGIIFFAGQSLDGGSPFEPGLPMREGKFGRYTRGEIRCYHTSYWATVRDILRRTANLRKNPGFAMPAVGIDRIGGTGPGPHRVRLLKVGGRIHLETKGRTALLFEDDGETYGPALEEGCIGLRQMAHSRRVSYTHFKVWKVEPK
jgi:hypothetical protein